MTDEEYIQKLRDDVANLFLDLRLEDGLTQREAARRMGVPQSNLNRVEQGGTDMRLSTLQKFAHGYGFRVEVSFIPIEEETDGPIPVPEEARAGD